MHISTRATGGNYFSLVGYGPDSGPEDGEAKAIGAKRGDIVEFSKASRRRMMTSLAVIDRTRTGLPGLVSLTYPDEVGAISEQRVKRHLKALRQAWYRRYGEVPICWRRENQTRKSGARVGEVMPHVHMIVFGLKLPEVRQVDEKGRVFFTVPDEERGWLADTWCRIVGTGLAKHRKVTAHPKSWLIADSWLGTLAYVSKYCAKVSDLPTMGRSWGWWFREKLPVHLISDEIPQDSFHPVRRVLQRLIEKRTKRKLRVYYRWQGLSAYLAEPVGARLVRWAWDIGWQV